MSGEKVYLCGPINGCTDDEAVYWREVIKEAIGEENTIDPMRRDYRGMEDTEYASIVEGDKDDIEGCDIVLANCWQVSVGTSMEILFAYHLGVPVISVVPLDSKVSPWLRYHSKVVYSLEDALDEMAGVVYFPVGEEATCQDS